MFRLRDDIKMEADKLIEEVGYFVSFKQFEMCEQLLPLLELESSGPEEVRQRYIFALMKISARYEQQHPDMEWTWEEEPDGE